jgi:hypothetical protein
MSCSKTRFIESSRDPAFGTEIFSILPAILALLCYNSLFGDDSTGRKGIPLAQDQDTFRM